MKKLFLISVLLTNILFSCQKDAAPAVDLSKNKLFGRWSLSQQGDEFPIGAQEVKIATGGVYEILENGSMSIAIPFQSVVNYNWTLADATHFLNVQTGKLYTIEQVDDTTLKLAYDDTKLIGLSNVAGKVHLYFNRISY